MVRKSFRFIRKSFSMLGCVLNVIGSIIKREGGFEMYYKFFYIRLEGF